MPDITYLLVPAEYFKVSTDQLMGVVLLSGEDYQQAKQDFIDYNDWNAGLSAEYTFYERNNDIIWEKIRFF